MIDTVFWLEVVEELDKAAKESLELYCPDREGCYSKERMLDFFSDGVDWLKRKIQNEQ